MCGKFQGKISDCSLSWEKETLERWHIHKWHLLTNCLMYLILFIHSGLEGRGWKHLWLWRHCFGSRQNHQGKGPWQREIWSPARNADHAKNWTSSKCCHFAGSLHRQRYYHFSFTFKDPYWKVLTLSQWIMLITNQLLLGVSQRLLIARIVLRKESNGPLITILYKRPSALFLWKFANSVSDEEKFKLPTDSDDRKKDNGSSVKPSGDGTNYENEEFDDDEQDVYDQQQP